MGISSREYDDIRKIVGYSYVFPSRGLMTSGASSIKNVFDTMTRSTPSKYSFRNNTEAYGHPLCIMTTGQNDYHRHLERLRRDVRSIHLGDEINSNYGGYHYDDPRQRDPLQTNPVVCMLMIEHPEDHQCESEYKFCYYIL